MAQKTLNNHQKEVVAHIYRLYEKDLFRYFLSCFHNEDLARDFVHDVFLRIMMVDVIMEQTAKSLLFITARNIAADYARRQTCHRQYAKAAAYETEVGCVSHVEQQMDGRVIRLLESQCIGTMKPTDAHIYNLFIHQEKHASEIAEELQMNIRTVEGRILRARKAMRDFLKKAI